MNNLLETHGLVKRYGDHVAVKGIDFYVDTGEVVGVIGPNGAGKSTLLEMILGLRTPDAGTIAFSFDHPHRQIGVQLQTTPFFRGLTTAENLTLFANFYGVRRCSRMGKDTEPPAPAQLLARCCAFGSGGRCSRYASAIAHPACFHR